MGNKYRRKAKREVKKLARKHWKVTAVILLVLLAMLLVAYFTGLLDRVIDIVYPDTRVEEPEKPNDNNTSSDSTGDGSADNTDNTDSDGSGDTGGSGDGTGGEEPPTTSASTPDPDFNSSIDLSLYKNLTTSVETIEDLKITFLDVGQGDCIIIELPDGKNMIIDSGENEVANRNTISEFTTTNNITTFDYLLLTHQDSDHAGNMAWVIDNYEIKYIFRPNNESTNEVWTGDLPDTFNHGDGYKSSTVTYGKFMNSSYDEGCPVEVFDRDSDFTNKFVYNTVEYSYTFNFLTPVGDVISYSDPNNYSPIMMLQYGERKILFTGDAEEDNIEEYVTTYGNTYNIDVLKVGHHGSTNATTTAFVSAIDPEYAIIQCGENNKYGHPHASALNMLFNHDNNITLYRTDNNGSIILTIDSDGIMNWGMVNTDTSENFTPGDESGTTATWNIDVIIEKKRKIFVA